MITKVKEESKLQHVQFLRPGSDVDKGFIFRWSLGLLKSSLQHNLSTFFFVLCIGQKPYQGSCSSAILESK